MGNVANVVTECHRTPSSGASELCEEERMGGGKGEKEGGDSERGHWEIYRRSGQPRRNRRLMARGRAGYLSPVGATT